MYKLFQPGRRHCIRVDRALLVIAGVLVGAGCWGCGESAAQQAVAEAPPPGKWLTIVTPHNEQIRRAFGLEFSAWYARQHGRSVFIDWVVRGTPECLEYVSEVALSQEVKGRVDVFFGGGITDHALVAERGQSRVLKLDDAIAAIPAEIGGLPTRDAAGHWFATGLSSFGIAMNSRDLELRGIAPPATWSDLAEERFYGWLGIADPGSSGSHRECMLLILQKYGWEDGWRILTRALANSRALVERSSTALQQTAAGVFLAGFAVNFDALSIQAVRSGRFEYVNPSGATAVTPDVISVMTNTSDAQLAEAFVRFCVGPEGQRLWGLSAEHSPAKVALYHYPIDPRTYELEAGKLCVRANPLSSNFGMNFDLNLAAQRSAVLAPLVRAACGDNHVLLQQAWAAVIASGSRADLLAELTAPLLSEAEAQEAASRLSSATPEQTAELESEWSRRYAERYRSVLGKARGDQ